MKITKSKDDINRFKTKRENANIGCHSCPGCGEIKTFDDYLNNGIAFKGISSGVCEFSEGIFRTKQYQIDWYRCNTCGCEWESEPY